MNHILSQIQAKLHFRKIIGSANLPSGTLDPPLERNGIVGIAFCNGRLFPTSAWSRFTRTQSVDTESWLKLEGSSDPENVNH